MHEPAEGAPGLVTGAELLPHALERQHSSCVEKSLLIYRCFPFALGILFTKQPKIALEKSFAHFCLLNCSGVMALNI